MSVNTFNPNQTSEPAWQNAGNQISVGFPSPAKDYLEAVLDLNKALIKNPSSTFYGRVKGLSMKDAGVDSGDLLVTIVGLRVKKKSWQESLVWRWN